MLILLAVAAGLLVLAIWGYNALANMRNVVKMAWADIDVQLKRRADLVPNLVETAKGYSGFERDVLEAVTNARGGIDPSRPPQERAAAEQKLGDRIQTVIAVAENYPELKATAHYMRLQEELSRTESTLAAARQYYNAAVRDYNTMLDSFPLGAIGRAFAHKRAEFFEIETAAEREPPSAGLSQ